MTSVKAALENVKEIAEIVRPIQIWLSQTQFKAIVGLLLYTLLLQVATFAVWSYLIHTSSEETAARIKELNRLTSESSYLHTIDAINLCRDNSDESHRLRGWYCQQAIESYKSYSGLILPDRMNEVIKEKAFGAMKMDVENLSRQIEFSKVQHAPKTFATKLLESEFIFWISISLIAILDMVYVFWIGLSCFRQFSSASVKN